MTPTRRDLLLRLGPAAFLAWPILGASRAAAAGPKKRFITFFSSSGVRQDLFWPKGTPGDFAPGRYTVDGTSLAGLKPHLADVIIPRGIKIDRGPGDSHEAGTVAALTGNHLRATTLSQKPVAFGESLDHLLAKTLCKETPEKLLVLGTRLRINRISKYTSYDERGYEIEPLQYPYTVYDRVFRRFVTGCGSATTGARAAEELALLRLRKKSVLDTVTAQTAAMKRLYGLDAEELQKLERMEASIRSVERRLDGAAVPAPATAGCAEVKRTLESPDRVPDDDASFPRLLKLQLDLIALALELDITRVITLSLSLGGSGGAPMRWLQWKGADGLLAPIDASHHNISHGLQRNVNNYLEKLEVIDRWNFDQFAYLIGKLKAIQEGTATALDSSILWYASDVGEGKAHTDTLLPFIVAGRAGGALKTGRYLSLSGAPRHQRLLTDFAQKLGVDTPEFGRPGASAGGSLL